MSKSVAFSDIIFSAKGLPVVILVNLPEPTSKSQEPRSRQEHNLMASTEELTADGDGTELDVQQISDGAGAEDHAAEQASVGLWTLKSTLYICSWVAKQRLTMHSLSFTNLTLEAQESPGAAKLALSNSHLRSLLDSVPAHSDRTISVSITYAWKARDIRRGLKRRMPNKWPKEKELWKQKHGQEKRRLIALKKEIVGKGSSTKDEQPMSQWETRNERQQERCWEGRKRIGVAGRSSVIKMKMDPPNAFTVCFCIVWGSYTCRSWRNWKQEWQSCSPRSQEAPHQLWVPPQTYKCPVQLTPFLHLSADMGFGRLSQ